MNYHTPQTVMFWSMILSSILLHTCNAATFSVSEERPCPMEIVTFTCTSPGTSLIWIPSNEEPIVVNDLTPINSPQMPWPGYTVTVTSRTSTNVTSTLSRIAENGITVSCSNPTTAEEIGSATIQLAGIPSSPRVISNMVQSYSVDRANVYLHWSIPTNNGGREDLSYTVTIFPRVQLSAAIVTSTSVNVTDVEYGEFYTVRVRAANCAGNSSSIALYIFSVDRVTCDPPSPPANGSVDSVTGSSLAGTVINFRCDNGLFPVGNQPLTCGSDGRWLPDPQNQLCFEPIICDPPSPPANGSILDNVHGSSSEGAMIYYRCDNGLIPVENQSSICGSDGTWSPNPQDVICSPETFICSVPDPPSNGFVTQISNATIVFGCNEGFFPQQNRTAICVAMYQWSTLPEEIECIRLPSSVVSPVGPIVGGIIGSLLLLIAVTVILIIVVLLVSRTHSTTKSSVPVYDEVSSRPRDNIKLNTNSAYGPVTKVTTGPVYEDVLPIAEEEIKFEANDAYGSVML